MLIEKLVDDNNIDIEKENIEMIQDLVLGNNKKIMYRETGEKTESGSYVQP